MGRTKEMRLLTEATDENQARRIVDALLVEGIAAQTRFDPATEIWVYDHDDLEPARAKLETYRQHGIPDATAQAASIRRNQRTDRERHEQQTHDLRRRWGGTSYAPGALTIFLIVACVAIGLLDLYGDPSSERMWNLTIDHWQSPQPLARIRVGEVWRLVTPIFLHFGVFHLGFNMMWLWSLGNQVEHNHGSLALLGLVLVAALTGNLGQYAATGPAFGGMSGVVYALFGFTWMNARFNRRRAYAIDERNTLWMMLWFLACATGMFGPIANVAHAVGLVVGLVAGVPAYVRHLRTAADLPNLEAGGWADVHLRGFRRFRRRHVTPFVPLWFLGMAALVITLELATQERPQDETPDACQVYAEHIYRCEDRLSADSFIEFSTSLSAALQSIANDPIFGTPTREQMCERALERATPVAARYGCLE